MRADKFKVPGLKSSDDMTLYSDTISKLDGVNAVRVDIMANTVTVDYDESKISEKELQSKINSVRRH